MIIARRFNAGTSANQKESSLAGTAEAAFPPVSIAPTARIPIPTHQPATKVAGYFRDCVRQCFDHSINRVSF